MRAANLAPALGRLGVARHHGTDRGAAVGQVGGQDVRGQEDLIEDRAGDLAEELAHASLDPPQARAVDHGGEAQHLPGGAAPERRQARVRERGGVFAARGVVRQDLGRSPGLLPARGGDRVPGPVLGLLLVGAQGHEGPGLVARVHGLVADGEAQARGVVDPDRDALALAPEVVTEDLLGGYEGLEPVLVDGVARGQEPGHEGANRRDRGVDLDDARGLALLEEGVVAGLAGPVLADLARDPLHAPGVGAVGVLQLDLDRAVCAALALQLALDEQAELLDPVQAEAGLAAEGLEVGLLEGGVWHGSAFLSARPGRAGCPTRRAGCW